MPNSIRARAFNQVAKEDEIYKLTEYLKINYDNGVTYHRTDGLTGYYDGLKNYFRPYFYILALTCIFGIL